MSILMEKDFQSLVNMDFSAGVILATGKILPMRKIFLFPGPI